MFFKLKYNATLFKEQCRLDMRKYTVLSLLHNWTNKVTIAITAAV